MGSVFSVFLQRCWAVFRELYFSRTIDLHSLRGVGSRVRTLKIGGSWAYLLEIRYADDISQTIAAPAASGILPSRLVSFLRDRLLLRYEKLNGKGVTIEAGED